MRLVETMWKEPGLNEQWVREEMELKRILQYMKIHGWRFDTGTAAALYGRLNEEYTKVRQEAVDLVTPKVVVGQQPSYYQAEGPDGVYHVYDTKGDLMKDWRQLLLPGEKTKASLQRRIIQGSPTIKYTSWNPTSRSQIIGFLQDKYQWMPTVWGKSQPKVREYDVRPSEFEEMRRKGLSPVVDEDVLGSLPYEECPTLSRLFMLQKRISQLYSGKQALMVHDHGGRIHASINANGTVTGRASHSNPNLSQVPASGKPFGEDFRALFLGEPGWVMVGGDASALELRELAAYLAFFDKGRYASLVTADGFDVHTDNAISMGFLPEDYEERLAKDEIKKGRSKAKPGYYGLVYGAGDTKLGKIVDGTAKDGARVRRMLYDGMPGIDKLLGKVQESAKRGYLRFPDGRHAFVRKPHSALNTLLQGVGGIIMKYAGVLLVRKLRENGLRVFGYDCPFWDRRQVLYDVAVLGWSHDEWQLTCRPKHADLVGQCIVDGIKEAGEHYNLRCPLDGAYDIGQSWADTH
jgi:DNA polymerase I-like protein with 3'-5' exonuclease and polymerase domains